MYARCVSAVSEQQQPFARRKSVLDAVRTLWELRLDHLATL